MESRREIRGGVRYSVPPMSEITAEHVAAAGVVGAGGAGFPTHVKVSASADTVIINAAECEPLLHKDKEVLRTRTEDLVAGLAAAMRLVGAKRGIVGIKAKYADVIDALRPRLAGDMEIAPLGNAYPAGDEFILVYDVLGLVIPPGGIPLNVGVVVMNVETAVNVAMSAERPVTQKYVSVAGAVANPVTLRVPVGATLSACVSAAGGASINDANYIVGGVMMGYIEENHDALVDKTTGGVIVLPNDHVSVRRRRRDWSQVARIGRSACDQCSFCTELCPRNLLGHPIEPHRAMRSLGFNLSARADVAGASFCCECNLCSFYSCPEDLDPREVCAENKRRLATDGVKWTDPPLNLRRAELHMNNRKAPMQRLMQKLDLNRFVNAGPLSDRPVGASKVGIKLKQHIGAPCEPAVRVGSAVKTGDLIGRVPVTDGKAALGAPVHASIDGAVKKIEDGVVWIEKTG